MNNIRSYWAAVRNAHDALPADQGFFYMMSLDDPTRGIVGGVVVQVDRQNAARRLVEKTHRIATQAEIDAHLEGEQKKREEYLAAEKLRLALRGVNPDYVQQTQPARKAK